MTPIDKRITSFIHKHHIFALATVADGKPWTATCFYTYLQEQNLFIFTSGHETLHAKQMLENPQVAGNIALETKIIGKIQGLQFSGQVRELQGKELQMGKLAYIKRFPVAAVMETVLWGLAPEMFKFTDNKLGFGRKLYWHADSGTP